MQLFRQIDRLPSDVRGGAVAIGNFDGVHLGHVSLIEQLRLLALQQGGPTVVFTFDPHPVRLLRPDAAPPPLTWTERKAQLLEKLGVDVMIAYPTDELLLSLTPEEFFARIVCDKLAARAMVEGPNFYFGRGRAGDVQLLGRLCAERQITLRVLAPRQVQGEYISSSRVREAIRDGQVGFARSLLTEPYRLRGLVTHGAARGSRLGFPTANIDAVDTLVPGPGVYAGRAYRDESSWPAAIHIGPSLTFGERISRVEAHLLGFSGTLYGQPLEVDFLERLRDIRPFASVDELKQQLARDVEATRQLNS